MEFRKATPEETEYILEHCAQSLHEGTRGLMVADRERALEITKPVVEQRNGYYLVAVDGGEVRAWVLVGTARDFFTEQSCGFIYDVYTLPEGRRQGLAKRLMQLAVEQLREAGHPVVRLNVFAGNPARTLYEELGFTELSSVLSLKL
ncbi:MAG: GNAT family N-acetyltransferase [Tumebacillaceae bacterium]